MPLTWKPDVWAKLAEEKPDIFLKELSAIRNPSASLFTKTYMQCVIHGFRALQKHQNRQYETTFFQEMAKRLPNVDAKPPERYDMGATKNISPRLTPVEYLQWQNAVVSRVSPATKFNYHEWLLELRRPSYDFDNSYQQFSVANAPEWAAAYVEIQRGNPFSSRLNTFLRKAPIQECIGVVNAAGSLHEKEKPLWLQHCLDTVLGRTQEMHASVSVHEMLTAMQNAWKAPSAQLDASVRNLVLEQPKGMSMLTHAWFGSHYGREPYTPMLEWWARQTSSDRGQLLHKWLSESSNWESFRKEVGTDKKPGLGLDMFTRDPIEWSNAQARDIVMLAPFETQHVRTFLARIIPAIHAAELTVEPKDFKSYLLNAWDALHEKAQALSIDGLLDLEP